MQTSEDGLPLQGEIARQIADLPTEDPHDDGAPVVRILRLGHEPGGYSCVRSTLHGRDHAPHLIGIVCFADDLVPQARLAGDPDGALCVHSRDRVRNGELVKRLHA